MDGSQPPMLGKCFSPTPDPIDVPSGMPMRTIERKTHTAQGMKLELLPRLKSGVNLMAVSLRYDSFELNREIILTTSTWTTSVGIDNPHQLEEVFDQVILHTARSSYG